jgi:hypothetical protein
MTIGIFLWYRPQDTSPFTDCPLESPEVMLQVVASPMIVILMTLEVSIMLLYNI